MDNCFDPLYVIAAKFNATTKLHFSERTVRRYIRKLNFQSRIAIQKPFLSKKNMSARVVWGRTHKEWTLEQWANVVFTDESCFTLRPLKNLLRVWRYDGHRLNSKQIVPTFKSGYQSVSVWGSFSLRGHTALVRTIGSFDRDTYQVIIDNHILPFVYNTHDGTASFILQEDNCGPHRAKSIAIYLANEERA